MGLSRNIFGIYDDGSLDVLPAATFFGTAQEAIALAASRQAQITYVFNGVHIIVEDNSDPNLLYRDYVRALCGNIDKNVGPHPEPVLSAEVLAAEECHNSERIGAIQ